MKASHSAAATRLRQVVAALPRKGGILLVRVYQRCVSPLLPPSCRYAPTCSHYAVEAIGRFGLLKGSWLAFKRILRCHPFHEGGYDPVPQTFELFSRHKKP